jgi:hypothetical protein
MLSRFAGLVGMSVCCMASASLSGCILLPLDDVNEGNDDTPAVPRGSSHEPGGPSPDPACVPDCSRSECGDDGCGGHCGTCDPTLAECVEGLCLYQSGVQSECSCGPTSASDGELVAEPSCASGVAQAFLCEDSGFYIECGLNAAGYPTYEWALVCVDAG